MTKPRLRIAPSPTGDPHIGTAYTALVNIAFAKRHGGEFILRIEDTDQARSTPESEIAIFDSLHWLGLTWSEGPDVGGPYVPYRQSERREKYDEALQVLLDKNAAFKCFCTPERLDLMRATQRKQGISPKYDGACLHLTPEMVAEKEAAGIPHVVRMRIPKEGTCTFEDGIYGTITTPWEDVDMQVLMKSDGMPTYHLANVVDDTAMGITHVIRGEEWVPSTPKHIKLYEHFGWQAPQFTHLPVLRNPDRTKLSKRKNPTSILWFKAQGYLPEAMLNYLGLPFVKLNEGDEELMTVDEFTDKYDFAAVSKAGSVFDIQKLDWLNGRWLREKLTEEDYLARAAEWLEGDIPKAALLLAQSRIVKFADLWPLVAFMQTGANLSFTQETFSSLKTDAATTQAILRMAVDVVQNLTPETPENLFEKLKEGGETLGLKPRLVTAPLFLAISGSAQSLPVTESILLLGKEESVKRLQSALNILK
ncbi:MAG: glutamate--tRNA ligase [Alphaproteobacteria bacterium CG_4_10_14_0_8_um_filter_53_9]|nr:MAG: glutamate--tRNA ligase [Alphaproteobacteria bacterium CG_4_10_14_0_8_um_filter_53_9]